ncbi:MAG TPA: dolichyl-phosphate beta-glucosyltransferase, partial [Ktedonobacterales bacterium]
MADDAQQPISLSIVIPAYNEAHRLPTSLELARAFLNAGGLSAEVIVVDDGSEDGTAAVVEEAQRDWSALKLLRQAHAGKGAAVRLGVSQAVGEQIALADADFSMPITEFRRFMPDALGDYDIAIASREAPGAHRYGEPEYRHIMGRVFNRLVQWLLLPGIEDTQCGFKFLRRAVAQDIIQQLTIDGWGFDVELLYIARRHGYQIREIGVPWRYGSDSRVSPLRDTLTMIRDIGIVWVNSRKGRYNPLPTA